MIDNYQKAIDFVLHQAPAFQQLGSQALRYDLQNITDFLTHLNNPHQSISFVHIAGTNGKGSVSHLTASALASSGYRVGLFTSPHLFDFRERIKVSREWISEQFVTRFVRDHQHYIAAHSISFFELTTAMAMAYFEYKQVDIAVVECGLGGRLDSTNTITPLVSVITTIGLDHCDILGDTIAQIAKEKAGILKRETPYIIGQLDSEAKTVIAARASALNAEQWSVTNWMGVRHNFVLPFMKDNVETALKVLSFLQTQGYSVEVSNIEQAWTNLVHEWGFYGRFLPIQHQPTILLEVGHNSQAISRWKESLKFYSYKRLILLMSITKERDIHSLLKELPKHHHLAFVETSNPRSMKKEDYHRWVPDYDVLESVDQVNKYIQTQLDTEDMVLIGGSFFLVGDYLKHKTK